MSGCVYVFLDEGGNFDFSVNGTKHFVITSVTVSRPFPGHQKLDVYKHDLIEDGYPHEYFHCSEDNSHVRGKVFGIIADHLGGMRIDSLIVEKCKTGPSLREESQFYPRMLGYLLKHVLERIQAANDREIVVITDTIPVQKKRRAIEKAVKVTLKEMLSADTPFRVIHHQSRSHYGLQIADYCNWAIFRKWERGDSHFYDMIKSAVRSEFDIFRTGNTRYY
ncbi:MAG: DUF3800 domain-containing protein [Magnetococcales bacterium]|nr:DUF3800 domain-containing protein [Magnetococcales bacterium]